MRGLLSIGSPARLHRYASRAGTENGQIRAGAVDLGKDLGMQLKT
jgi:hypothetical protein